MGRITAIEPQKRRPKRRSIFVDGEFVAGVDQEVVFSLGLKVGQEVDEKRLQEMMRAEEIRRARDDALNLLSYRSRSTKELERRLKQKGYEEETIREAVTGLQRVDLINDERFTNDWIKNRMTYRPMGKMRLTWELRQKGVAPELIDDALGEIDEEKEYEAALELAKSKAGKITEVDVRSKRQKLASLLQRRGFNWDTVSRVMIEIFREQEEEEF